MDLTAWLRINRLGLRYRPPTSDGNTKGSRSDALAPDSTTGLMPPSPPSLTPSGTPNGPVAPSLSSVIEELIVVAEILLQESGRVPEGYLVDAFKWLDATLAQDVEPARSSASTSAKQVSPLSAPALTFVPSGLVSLTGHWMNPDEVFRVYVPGVMEPVYVPAGHAVLIRAMAISEGDSLGYVSVQRGEVSQ